MKLTKQDIQLIEDEFRFKSIFQTDFREYSRKMWNKHKKDIFVTYEGGEFKKADQDGWKF